MKGTFAIVVHGGAFVDDQDFTAQTEFLRTVLAESSEILRSGGDALDAVTRAVVLMENSGLYIAGKGAGPNSSGHYELDSSIMDGKTGRAGAVAALHGFKNPVLCARAVMEQTGHVMLAGSGAAEFCASKNLETVTEDYFTPTYRESQVEKTSHGTVGAVALDRKGHFAAATSTGGIVGKLAGRVGDTPIPGAATIATKDLAVSTTGYGEYFMRNMTAKDVAARVEYGGETLGEAADHSMERIRAQGGWGGIIAVGQDGQVEFSFTNGMHRGYADETGKITVASHPDPAV